jgi:putative ABC transport system substrate-binding protein
MNRRAVVTGLGALFALPCAARAQQAGRVWRIGQLVSSEPVGLDAFRQRLGELGYFEGQNLLIEHRNADGRPERLPALVAELVRLRVNVIVTFGTQAALAAKQGTTETPIVMATSGDAVGAGLIRPQSSRRSLSWSSTSRLPKRSASRSRRRCCCGRIR